MGVEAEVDIFDKIDFVVEEHIITILSPIISKAEKKRTHEDKGCYCKSCLRKAADDANEAVLWVVGADMNSKVSDEVWEKIKPFWFVVAPSKHGFNIMRLEDIKEKQNKNWLTDRIDSFSPYGSLPAE